MTESLKALAPHLTLGAPFTGDAFPLLWERTGP
jgi:hypothetical protein